MKIINEPDNKGVNISLMKDGEIGVITDWGVGGEHHVGTIVQRYKNILIALGNGAGNCWPQIFESNTGDCFVRILPKGTVLEI